VAVRKGRQKRATTISVSVTANASSDGSVTNGMKL
jgi:hypothetical protein